MSPMPFGLGRRSAALWPHLVLSAFVVLTLGPFLWIAAAAFRTQISLMMGEVLFTPTLANMEELLFSNTSNYVRSFLNSLFVAAVTTLVVLAAALGAAYSLVRLGLPRWLSHAILLWALVFQMIPPITLVGAWFTMFRSAGLDGTYTSLVMAQVALNLPLALWIVVGSVRELPIELEEAARLDGASVPAILLKIVLPLARPGLFAACVLVFIFSWNEFPVALNLTSQRTGTVPVAIASFAQEYVIQHTAMASAALLSTLPALVLLLFAQRAIVRGLTAGALK